jgi:hypothetical protein
MSTLMFRCPQTDRPIDSGIETDPFALRGLQSLTIFVHCPYCHKEHGQLIEDGHLGTAGEDAFFNEVLQFTRRRRPRDLGDADVALGAQAALEAVEPS